MYTTEDQVRASTRLTDPSFDITSDQIIVCINKAQARIDAFLRTLYKVPLVDPVPAIIQSIATDYAASFAIEWFYSQRKGKDETGLDDRLFKRAEADLQRVVSQSLLDGLPGVVSVTPPQSLKRPAIRSTTEYRSSVEGVFDDWP